MESHASHSSVAHRQRRRKTGGLETGINRFGRDEVLVGNQISPLSTGLYGKAPPERGTFFIPVAYEWIGISLVEVYERVISV